jgi:hypothetical protein
MEYGMGASAAVRFVADPWIFSRITGNLKVQTVETRRLHAQASKPDNIAVAQMIQVTRGKVAVNTVMNLDARAAYTNRVAHQLWKHPAESGSRRGSPEFAQVRTERSGDQVSAAGTEPPRSP